MSWSSLGRSSRRGWLVGTGLLGLPLLLGACGFRPLYGGSDGVEVATDLAAIEVTAPRTRLGRILENQLIDDLNPAGLSVPKRYWLDVRLERTKKALAIQLDDRITRYDLTLAAFFWLREGAPSVVLDAAAAAAGMVGSEAEDGLAGMLGRDEEREVTPGLGEAAEDGEDEAGSGRLLYRSAVRRVATYNVIREPFATLVAEQDADRRAAVEVSREIRTLLTIFLENELA